MSSACRNNLVKIIACDLWYEFRTLLMLMMFVLLSALGLTFITYSTRSLVMQHEQAVNNQKTLDHEWRNLILEEKVLGDPNRIERIARQRLNMQHLSIDQKEFIRLQK